MPRLNLNKHVKVFTLIELLIVLSLMIILAGIGIKGYKRMSSELSLQMTETRVRQLVNSTIQEAKRNKIPMQIQITIPENSDKDPSIVRGGTGALVGYWGFEGETGQEGLNRAKLIQVPNKGLGFYGTGATFSGTNSLKSISTSLLNFDNNVYIEAMLKPNIDALINSEATVIDGGEGKFKLIFKGDGRGLKIIAKHNNKSIESGQMYFPDDDQWHKVGIAVVKGDSNHSLSIYIDNIFIAHGQNINDAVTLEPQEISIGSNEYFGDIDEVKVFRIGEGSNVIFDPKIAFINGLEKNKTHIINISPAGTVISGNDIAIQICSAWMIGEFKVLPQLGDNHVRKVRSSLPKSGYLSSGDGEIMKYEWDGANNIKVLKEKVHKTEGRNEKFQYVKAIRVMRDGKVN